MNINIRFTILFLFLTVLTLSAQNTIPAGGADFLNYKALRNISLQKGETGSIKATDAEQNRDITLTVTTDERPQNVWNLSTRLPVWKRDLQPGSVLLLAFEARTILASLETEEAKAMFVFGIAEKSKNNERKSVSISGQWQQYFIPVLVREKVNKKDFFTALQFGYPPQQFEMRKMRFLAYEPGTDIKDMPRTRISYDGSADDAAWRAPAAERIEKHRKGDFTLNFTKDGKPVDAMPVQVTLHRHDFGWGAAFGARKMIADPQRAEHFARAFNLGVFENDVKIKFWEKEGRKEQVLQATEMLQAHDIDLKGHVLVWPGFRHLPQSFKNNKDNPEKLKSMLDAYVDDVLTATQGKISRWDVVNEAYTNQDLQELTGSEEILFEAFREMHRRDSTVLRYVNEYGIISKGGLNDTKREWYYDYIKRIDENTGGLVDGIGIQSHIGSDLTPIPKVLEILDYYGELDKKISISEFTMDIDDAQVRYAYTRDFMTAAFSHPKVFEFLFWGWQWEKADIYTEDWKPGSMGHAFFEMVHDRWKTNLFLETNESGQVAGRGFYGVYEYSYFLDGEVKKGNFEVLPSATRKVIEVKIK